MDANGTRYHLLLGRDDWETVAEATHPVGSVLYDPVHEELTLRPEAFRFLAGRGDRAPEPADRRGAAADRFGNIYWVAESGAAVWAQSAGTGTSAVFWEPGVGESRAAERRERRRPTGGFAAVPADAVVAARPTRLAGLAVTEDHYLVVGTAEPAGLLVFDLHSPAPPRRELWPADVAFIPFDLCARAGGGVFLLDREHRRLWELDRHLQVVSRGDPVASTGRRDFGPRETAEPRPRARIDDGDAVSLDGDPFAVEGAPGGRVLVLDRGVEAGVSTVRLIAPGVAGDTRIRLEDRPPGGEAYRVIAHDVVLVPGAGLGTLYAVDRAGNQAYAFDLDLQGSNLSAVMRPDYLPLRLFGGKALIAGPDGPLYDFGSRWVPLVRQRRPRFAPLGVHHPPVFDATVPGTVWHRLMLDAVIPPQSAIVVESRAADDRLDLPVMPWQPEPPLIYRRFTGSELPYRGSGDRYDTWEVLFQRARGRHLQLRLTLTGDGRRTPRIRALRAYYPRFSYRERYLPKAYGEDPVSASFLDGFLANVEGITTGLEDRIAAAQAIFDPRTCPPEALDWLLCWFDVTADPMWDEPRRRLFLRHAMRFFALRGTVAGLRCALRLALDPCADDRLFDESGAGGPIRIIERFRTRRVPAVRLGDPTEFSGPRIGPLSARWDPTQGGEALTERWREAVGDDAAVLPLTDSGPLWRDFWRRVAGIEPPAPPDPDRWRSFLTGRYRRIEALNDAYGLIGTARHTGFVELDYPETLPADGTPLRDWYQFVVAVLAAVRTAHRFTVLLAVPSANLDETVAEERRAIVRRIVELQKPAHTTFDVRFFWAAFRIGEARLGEDTVVGLGSRDPRFHRPLVLGQEHAGESSLGGGHAPVLDRVGRDVLNR